MIDFRIEPEPQTQWIRQGMTQTPEIGWTDTAVHWSESAVQRARDMVIANPKLSLWTAFFAGGAIAWLVSRK